MENNKLYDPVCLIYPGTYVPIIKEAAKPSVLQGPHEGTSVSPLVNVTELPGSFKVEVAIPGVEREDFLVHSEGNILSVSVLKKESPLREGEKFNTHEFNYECFDRHILLPGTADFELANAEYKAGILRIIIPRANQPSRNLQTRIAVY